jgi:hypothetical protein
MPPMHALQHDAGGGGGGRALPQLVHSPLAASHGMPPSHRNPSHQSRHQTDDPPACPCSKGACPAPVLWGTHRLLHARRGWVVGWCDDPALTCPLAPCVGQGEPQRPPRSARTSRGEASCHSCACIQRTICVTPSRAPGQSLPALLAQQPLLLHTPQPHCMEHSRCPEQLLHVAMARRRRGRKGRVGCWGNISTPSLSAAVRWAQ